MNLHRKIYSYIEKKGFNTAVCHAILVQLYISSFSLILGLLLLPWNNLLFWFGFGATLSNWNFFAIAFFVQKVIISRGLSQGTGTKLAFLQVILSNLRLFFTIILVYGALVTFNANPFAILVGLSLSLLTMPVFVLRGINSKIETEKEN